MSAEAVSANQYRVTFSEVVTPAGAQASGFLAVSDDGTAPPPATSITGATSSTVLATFPGNVGLDEASTVKILVQPNSIFGSDGVSTNLGSQAAVSTPNWTPGLHGV